ncbi:MAG: PEP-utilizing enzyme [Promethearchaeota archaeon]|jgi:phosphohistidine swiveling domain-containing protein
MKKVGKGMSCSLKSNVTGVLVYVKTIEDVINLFDCAAGKICIVNDAGMTTLSPILPDLAGIICTTGSVGSHLAIISREFGIPCLMGTEFLVDDLESLDNKRAKITHDGRSKGFLHLLE